uniref:Plp n=1 Tax=Ganoderma boninense TaxID=34458 RepID=A0A5K1K1Q0_9APHY|nr:Plp [Ganoderma boninense]
MDGHKRKRDDEGTIVTFYAPDRTFARVYKGQSLEETKNLVRKKLGLSDDTSLRFARLHEGKVIELDDDEDFEAFRHIARSVSTLDVSVFVGQNGPSVFTQQASQQASTNSKRGKNRRANAAIVPASSGAAAHNAVSRRDPMPGGQDNIPSTLDANGVPKKKRKRKGVSPSSELTLSSLVQTEDVPQATPEANKASGSLKKRLPHTLSSPPSLPMTQDTVLPSPEPPGLSKSSKRKRQDAPESPPAPGIAARAVASSSIPSQPSSPSSPVKKKRRKEKGSEDAEPSPPVEKQSMARSDKKSRHAADDAASTSSKVVSAPTADSDDAVSARKAAKRARKEARAKERQLTETREEPVSSKADGKQPKKRKTGDIEEAQATNDTQGMMLSSLCIPSKAKLASRADKQKKHVQAPIESQTVPVDVPVPEAPAGDTPAKGGKERKSKVKSRQSEHVAVEPVEDLDTVGM